MKKSMKELCYTRLRILNEKVNRKVMLHKIKILEGISQHDFFELRRVL